MKSPFIIVRYDRLKNKDLQQLCISIMNNSPSYINESMHLTAAFNRFEEQRSLLNNLDPKQRKAEQSDKMTMLRKSLDDMVSGLLLNIKALERAKFDDQKDELAIICAPARKLFKNYIHVGILEKLPNMNALLKEVAKKGPVHDAYLHLGLMRYVDAFINIQFQIDKTRKNINEEKDKKPKAGITIPTKEKIIGELRFLLKTIEVISISNPEIDYNQLIKLINGLLTQPRAQLRNLASRRKTAKSKSEKKKASDNMPIVKASLELKP